MLHTLRMRNASARTLLIRSVCPFIFLSNHNLRLVAPLGNCLYKCSGHAHNNSLLSNYTKVDKVRFSNSFFFFVLIFSLNLTIVAAISIYFHAAIKTIFRDFSKFCQFSDKYCACPVLPFYTPTSLYKRNKTNLHK